MKINKLVEFDHVGKGEAMKELKFRVWDVESECYIDEKDWAGITPEGQNIWVVEEEEVSVLPILGEFIIEQYTGLKDKNGKEIYEGDIVRWSFKVDRNSEPTYTADAVKWESYAEEEWPYSTISGFTLPESEDGYEVIGNIHENLELLGEEEE